MAHEITDTDHMFSGSNTTPWHGLGTVVAGQLSSIDALTAAKLNWDVVQEFVFDADMNTLDGFRLNRRNDTKGILGIVNEGWTPVQNARLLEIAESLVQVDGTDFKPVIETAGSLRGGQIVWACVKTGERKFADSNHSTYLLLSNGHDGKRAVKGTLTDVRVVCNNTLRMAEAGVTQLYVTHAKGVESRLATAIETLGWANEQTRSTFAIYEALANASIAKDTAHKAFKKLVKDTEKEIANIGKRSENKVETLMTLFSVGKGNGGKTAFDYLNAATDYVDHARNFRNTGGNISERRFLDSNLGGLGDKMKARAFKQAKVLAGY